MGLRDMVEGVDYFEGAQNVPMQQQVDTGAETKRFQLTDTTLQARLDELLDKVVCVYLASPVDVRCYYVSDVKKLGFTILSPGVLSHPSLPDWVIKGGPEKETKLVMNAEGVCGAERYGNLHRVSLAGRIRQVVDEEGLTELIVPEKWIWRYPFTTAEPTLNEQYFVLSKNVKVLSHKETEARLHELPCEKVVRIVEQVCTVIERVGFNDVHFGNLRLTEEDRLALIDTEPQGVLVDLHDETAVVPSIDCGARVGLLGLATLFEEICPDAAAVAKERLDVLREKRASLVAP